MLRPLLVFVVLLLIGLTSYFGFKKANVAVRDQTEPQSLMTEAKATDILAEIKKSPLTLVNIWATWCDPCREEFPFILAMREKYKSRGLQVVFVSADFSSQRSEAFQFLKSNHVNFQTFHKNEEDLKFIETLYPQWSGAIPASLIFNQSGKLLDHWQGGATQEQFEAAIEKALKG